MHGTCIAYAHGKPPCTNRLLPPCRPVFMVRRVLVRQGRTAAQAHGMENRHGTLCCGHCVVHGCSGRAVPRPRHLSSLAHPAHVYACMHDSSGLCRRQRWMHGPHRTRRLEPFMDFWKTKGAHGNLSRRMSNQSKCTHLSARHARAAASEDRQEPGCIAAGHCCWHSGGSRAFPLLRWIVC